MQPWEDMPIYKKAMEIHKLVESLIALVKESELPHADEVDLDLLNDKFIEMSTNASEIISLISAASQSYTPYDYAMENAVFIKKAAQEIQADAIYIEDMGLNDIDYLDLLHDEIDALRQLFVEWIKTFELWKYGGDDWGLFSPEGIEIINMIPEEEEDEDEDDRLFGKEDLEDDDDEEDDDEY